MRRARAGLAALILLGLALGSGPVLASGSVATTAHVSVPAGAPALDDPFYDWDLEAYRSTRSPDSPSGGMLPLPDTTSTEGTRVQIRAASIGVDAADAPQRVAIEEAAGLRVPDPARGRAMVAGSVVLPARFGIDLAGRWTVGEGSASSGDWLDRAVYRLGSRLEVRAGLTRAFWGEGSEGSLLLGRTAPPTESIRLRSVRPWRLPFVGSAGRLQGAVFLSYLDDRSRTIPYPLLHGERIEWEPTGWARLVAARTILLGGAGRTEKFNLGDVWDVLLARNENIKGPRGHADSDQKASFTLEVRMPRKWTSVRGIQGARAFYEYAGEDSFDGLLPTATARNIGASVVSRGWTTLFEYAETVDDVNRWYAHTIYGPDAYTYHGYSIGHPMATDGRSRHARIWTPTWRNARAQFWWRLRGHGHELWQAQHGMDGKGEAYREESVGVRVRCDTPRLGILDVGLEATRESGKVMPRPAPPVRWMMSAALRWPIARSASR